MITYMFYLRQTGKPDSRESYRDYLDRVEFGDCPYEPRIKKAIIDGIVNDPRCWNKRYINTAVMY